MSTSVIIIPFSIFIDNPNPITFKQQLYKTYTTVKTAKNYISAAW